MSKEELILRNQLASNHAESEGNNGNAENSFIAGWDAAIQNSLADNTVLVSDHNRIMRNLLSEIEKLRGIIEVANSALNDAKHTLENSKSDKPEWAKGSISLINRALDCMKESNGMKRGNSRRWRWL